MAGQIPADSFAGSLSDPGIDPFEVPEAPPKPPPAPAGQEHVSAKPVPGPISPNNKLQPENMYSRMRNATLAALNNPIINTPVPNPAYSPQLNQTADKVLGAIQNPASVYPPALKNAADKFQQGIASATNWMDPQAKDIAGMLAGTVFPEQPAAQALWGGAKFAMKGLMEYEPWKAAMLEDAAAAGRTDATLESRLPKMYEKSKGIYEAHVAKTPLDQLGEHHLPNLSNVVDQYNKGIEGQDWYLKTRPELERQFGPDSDLFINMLAATSPNATVPANMSLALKAYKAYKNGLTDFRAFSDNPAHPGFMKPVIDNLNHVIHNEPISGQKIINFAKNLRGETEPVTVDRWMMRALGMPKASLGVNTYKFADYWLSQVAHDIGIEPRQLQAAVWKTAREVGGQSAASGQPFEAMLAKRLAKDPDLNALLTRVRQSGAPQPTVHAKGGAIRLATGGAIDGGWFGENAPSGRLRMGYADGGVADTLFGTGALPPDPSMTALSGAVKDYFKPQPLTAENIVNSFSSNQDPGSYIRSAGQGIADPIYAAAQAATTLPGLMTDQQRADLMKSINEQREGYTQSLPGGREDKRHGFARALAGVYALGKVLPDLPEFGEGFAGAMGSGALEGGIYGAFDPEEGAEPYSWGEKAKQALTGAALGSILHPGINYVEKMAGPVIANLTRTGAEQAASPQVERLERAAGLEAERGLEEAGAQPGFAERTFKQALHSLDDVIKPRKMLRQASQPAQQKLSDWQGQNNLNQTTDPSWQEYLKASGQGGYASGGQVYEGLRRRTLAALQRPR